MKNWFVFPIQLVRTAGRSLAFLPRPTADMLSDGDFRRAIALASGVVYAELEKAGFLWEACSAKLQATLQRYHQRICSRATPFGAFAGVGLVGIGREALVLDGSGRRLLCLKGQLDGERSYQLHPALYLGSQGWRCFSLSAEDGQETLRMLEREELAAGLVEHRDEMDAGMLGRVLGELGMDEGEQADYLRDLKGEGILQVKPAALAPVVGEMGEGRLSSELYSCMMDSFTGGIPLEVGESLAGAARALEKLSPLAGGVAWTDFKERFKCRYERQMVPLLEVMDPEDGLTLEQGGAGGGQDRTKTEALLLAKWVEMDRTGDSFRIAEGELAPLEATLARPAGLGLLYERHGTEIWLKAAAGGGASALAARFSLFDGRIRGLCRRLCRMEEQVNEGVVFADVNLQGDPSGVMLGLHAPLRRYEIPLFGAAGTKGVVQLPLHDLYLFMEGDELWFWSLSLQKRVVPRINSAFNYRASRSALLRFLGDLQHEGAAAGYHFALRDFFPGQAFLSGGVL